MLLRLWCRLVIDFSNDDTISHDGYVDDGASCDNGGWRDRDNRGDRCK